MQEMSQTGDDFIFAARECHILEVCCYILGQVMDLMTETCLSKRGYIID